MQKTLFLIGVLFSFSCLVAGEGCTNIDYNCDHLPTGPIPFCRYDQSPNFQGAPYACCRVCRYSCPTGANCDTRTDIPDCAAGVASTRNTTTCCPVCRRQVVCTVDPTTIALCADGVVPTINPETHCASCRLGEGHADGCTAQKVAACTAGLSSLPICRAGTNPTRTDDCCMSCRYAPAGDYCNDAKKAACAAVAPPICATGVSAEFNATSCCRTCVPPASTPSTGSTCTQDNFKACVNAAPVCLNGEEPVVSASRCCATCRRAERTCTPEQVAKCIVDTPRCVGTTPTVVDGDCCPSCRLAPPTCDPVCTDNNICVKIGDAAQCKPRLSISLLLNSTNLATRRALCNLTRGELRELIHEVVQRYCDNPNRKEDCNKFKTAIAGIDLAIAADFVRDRCEHNGVPVEIHAPDGVTDNTVAHFTIESRFRSFAASNVGVVVTAAANDPDASGGAYDVTSVDPGNNGAGSTIAPTFFLLFAALIGFLF